ncbi:hypothetical protein GGX14DRAFT_602352 [Mycena pura]|uniref:Uncharacterized protein n=1 Tax=Mycena pura TaxID=153505 RepID=A0AAD6VQE6_9AGAR|nr:hypothetical protein GGX14DRAFT_602352 [Mycena pura]
MNAYMITHWPWPHPMAAIPLPSSLPPKHDENLERVGQKHEDSVSTTPLKHEGLLQKIGLEDPHAAPAQPFPRTHRVLENIGLAPQQDPATRTPQHREGVLEKPGLAPHEAPPRPPSHTRPTQPGVLQKPGVERAHVASPPPPPPPAVPIRSGVLEKLGLGHPDAYLPLTAIASQHEGVVERPALEQHAPPAPRKHEGVLETLGLEHRSAPDAPHNVASSPTKHLADKLGIAQEHGLSGVLHQEGGKDENEGDASSLSRKICSVLHREGEGDLVRRHDESTYDRVADAVKREYDKVEHALEDYMT